MQSDSEESSIDNNTNRPQQLTNPMQVHPDGSLLNCFPCPTSTPNEDADHILLWLEIMESKPIIFEHEIARNLCQTKMAPALFVILPKWSKTVKLTHGFTSMLLINGQHWADGQVGFFLGDHIAVHLPLATDSKTPD